MQLWWRPGVCYAAVNKHLRSAADLPCRVPGCLESRWVTSGGHVRTWCQRHLAEHAQAWQGRYRQSHARPAAPRVLRETCSVDGCGQPRERQEAGWAKCRDHRLQHERRVDERKRRRRGAKPSRSGNPVCAVEGCTEPRWLSGETLQSRCRAHTLEQATAWRRTEDGRAARQAWRKSPAGRACNRAWKRAWSKTPAGREARLREKHRREERELGLEYRYRRLPFGPCAIPACLMPARVIDLAITDPCDEGHIEWDHEPALGWLRRHPEYDGPCVLRPAHRKCNGWKSDRPDWALAA